MAQKKPNKSKKSASKKIAKPEYAIKVVPKKALKPAPVTIAKKPKKVPKQVNFWSKLSRAKKIRLVFVLLLSIIILVSGTTVAMSIKRTNDALNRAALAADSLAIVTAKDVADARIVGSTEQLTTEIDNYQSAPADLQAYALQDYRKLKQRCIVNGEIYGSLSYAIASVADAQYAQIKRNCNGEQTQILKKFGDKWTLVHEGNDPPLCSLVNDLMIPQRVSLNCVIGGTTYLNPNP